MNAEVARAIAQMLIGLGCTVDLVRDLEEPEETAYRVVASRSTAGESWLFVNVRDAQGAFALVASGILTIHKKPDPEKIHKKPEPEEDTSTGE